MTNKVIKRRNTSIFTNKSIYKTSTFINRKLIKKKVSCGKHCNISNNINKKQ